MNWSSSPTCSTRDGYIFRVSAVGGTQWLMSAVIQGRFVAKATHVIHPDDACAGRVGTQRKKPWTTAGRQIRTDYVISNVHTSGQIRKGCVNQSVMCNYVSTNWDML
ncbi:hypothetical protein BaRGS_00021523 [Batillaria attramentaria]|uniref:Peptidase S1 domain-containing protein n=1 Tax=Batillaria attramentaria TaxID=370345 RepID=A0ABD0KJQ2_9CAEN